jgi:hypothetical protein
VCSAVVEWATTLFGMETQRQSVRIDWSAVSAPSLNVRARILRD